MKLNQEMFHSPLSEKRRCFLSRQFSARLLISVSPHSVKPLFYLNVSHWEWPQQEKATSAWLLSAKRPSSLLISPLIPPSLLSSSLDCRTFCLARGETLGPTWSPLQEPRLRQSTQAGRQAGREARPHPAG